MHGNVAVVILTLNHQSFVILFNFFFISNLKISDPKYNDIALNNFIEKRNLDKKSNYGFLFLNDETISAVEKKFFNNRDNFYFHKIKDLEKLIENEYIFIICFSGSTKTQEIYEINNYLAIFDKKVLGWFLFEDK